MTELLDRGAGAIAAAVRAGKVKARDVAEAAIARVEARNGGLTAIVDFDPVDGRHDLRFCYAGPPMPWTRVASRALTDRWWACLTP